MFRIKICGITNVDDALFAAGQGADALGLNFYSRSPRYVSPELAGLIVNSVEAAPAGQKTSIGGVFVNEPLDSWGQILNTSRIHFSQFHGDEPPDQLAALRQHREERLLHGGNLFAVKAFRCQGSSLSQVKLYLELCQTAGGLPDAILLDAFSPNAYGGTGEAIDWHVVREQRDQLLGLPIILAGGLKPDNIAEAIRTARPDGVDVASGVEVSPGKKDPIKVRDFIAAAQAAFAELTRAT